MEYDKPVLALLDDYQDVALKMADWSEIAKKVRIEQVRKPFANRSEATERLSGVSVIVAMRERTVFDAALLESLPNLKLLVTTGMVNASIDMEAAKACGITVCGTPGSRGAAAEHTWALLMALARSIPDETAGLRSGDVRWQRTVGFELRGRTLGIIGFGNLGRRVARFGRAFDMEVMAWSRSLTDEVAAENGVRRAESLDALLSASDVVSVHLPLTSDTRGLIGKRELGLMKPGSYLLNTARGPIIDEVALLEALRSHKIAGAGLDVFDREPLPLDHPFRTLPNVVATPHIGYVTQETYELYYGGTAEVVMAFLNGSPIRVLNP